jgi:hypothetical protein
VNIDELCELVMELKPNNFMAMNGAAAGILGANDSGSDAIVQLQRTTLQFADCWKNGAVEDVKAVRKELIGKAMVAVALDALPEETADEIADAATQLAKEKN